jgi:hypothetical protein
MDVPHPPPPKREPSTGLLVVGGPIAAGDVPALCERLSAVIATSDGETIVCDVGGLPANVKTVEALARLQLTARRRQRRIRLRRASPELESLLEFVGLGDVVPVRPRPKLASQRGRHAEQGEHPLGVEERVDRDDPPV